MIPMPLLLSALTLFPVAAEATSALPSAGESLTVRELMRLDTELALEAARRRRAQVSAAGLPATGGAPRADAAHAGSDTLRLVGIYGVGQRLFAEVRDGGHRLLFLRGHVSPVGRNAEVEGLRLKAMAGSCVHLQRHEEETVLCLSRAGGE